MPTIVTRGIASAKAFGFTTNQQPIPYYIILETLVPTEYLVQETGTTGQNLFELENAPL